MEKKENVRQEEKKRKSKIVTKTASSNVRIIIKLKG